MAHGIYIIINLVDNKVYIGQTGFTAGFKFRWREHINTLRRGQHKNRHLRNAWLKYGEKNFEFKILEVYSGRDGIELTALEQKWIDLYKVQTKLYNSRPAAGTMRGYKHTDEAKAKISEAGSRPERRALLITAWKDNDLRERHGKSIHEAFKLPEIKDRHREALIEAMARPEVRKKFLRTKLTDDEVRAIRAATGLQKDIAAQFGISATFVNKIKKRYALGWIPD